MLPQQTKETVSGTKCTTLRLPWRIGLRAYLVFLKFYNLSETHLNSSNSPDDDTLEICGSNLVPSDQPFQSKRGGVCICYKN